MHILIGNNTKEILLLEIEKDLLELKKISVYLS